MQVKEEEQLLLFALKHAENLEPLGRWIKLQLETNPALASVSEVAAEHCMPLAPLHAPLMPAIPLPVKSPNLLIPQSQASEGDVCVLLLTGRTSAQAADPRRKANKLSQAGRWKEAVAMADRDSGASDALLTEVVDGVALQLMQVGCPLTLML